MGDDDNAHPLDIPAFLLRDVNNRAEFMKMEDSNVESRPAKTKAKVATAPKANGHVKPVKAANGKPDKVAVKSPAKAKTAPKATAKPAKAPDKAKAAKPKAESKVEKDQFGFRKGSAKSRAVAMYARKNGATLAEVKEAVGSVQLNVLVALESDGRKVERIKEDREGQRAVTRYILKA